MIHFPHGQYPDRAHPPVRLRLGTDYHAHRPDKRNALSRAMQIGLCEALADADQDAGIRSVILTGSDPVFCAGNDVTDSGQFADRYAKQFWAHPARSLLAMRKPVICAVNGACVSGGLRSR